MISGRALNNNAYDQKNEPTIFCPAEYTIKTKPETNPKSNPKPKIKCKRKPNSKKKKQPQPQQNNNNS